jgi:prepilin-type N-terminal cleavage/methylation domain-containing protein
VKNDRREEWRNLKKGFTLLELLIVIIVIGLLSALGLTQYSVVVERSRGAEARQILGQLRSICGALYMNSRSNLPCLGGNVTNLGLGDNAGEVPNTVCANSHFFRYETSAVGTDDVIFTATRCAVGTGKTPGCGTGTRTLVLTVDYAGENATWTSTNGY